MVHGIHSPSPPPPKKKKEKKKGKLLSLSVGGNGGDRKSYHSAQQFIKARPNKVLRMEENQ